MASTINAITTGVGGIVTSADASGILQLQTAGVTALSISAAQVVSFTNPVTLTSPTLTSATLTSATLTTPTIDSAQVPTISGTAPLYMCRAWVNFNGTGTVVIRASGNVSSITDNGTGDYTINFTTAMPDTNYTTVGSGFINVGSYGVMFQVTGSGGTATTYTTSAVRINTRSNETSTLTDSAYVFGLVSR